MYRITFSLLLICSLLHGGFLIQHYTAGESYPQRATPYIVPISGSYLSETAEPSSGFHLRRRFSETEYHLYRGRITPYARSDAGNLQFFLRPSSMSKELFYKMKYYDRERINSHGDISECYFSGDTLWVVGYVRVSYRQNGGWSQLSAEQIGQQVYGTGDIAVRTNPPGAQIYLDGFKKGVETPNYLTDLKQGKHTIRFMHPDFASSETTVTVVSGQILQLTLQLKTRYGGVVFSGFPRGASVRLDGRVMGKLPCSVGNLKPGAYVFSVDSPFHSRKRVSVQVGSGKTEKVTVMLSKAYGVISLPRVPINVPWQINGDVVASGALRFNPGTHRVFWGGGGVYKPVDTVIKVNLGYTSRLDIPFDIRTGGIKVLPLPMACSLFIDSVYRGQAPCVVDDLTVGIHKIELRRSGFSPFFGSVKITGESVVQLRCQLELQESVRYSENRGKKEALSALKKSEYKKTGELSFVSFPPCAEVYEGDSLVAITGKGSVKIPVGRYQFRFVNGLESTVRTVTVASGERKAVLVNFGE